MKCLTLSVKDRFINKQDHRYIFFVNIDGFTEIITA